MTTADTVWAALILAGAAFEAYALANGKPSDTLSETTRSVFRTRTSKVGRAVFLVAWLGLATWFPGHLLDWWA